LLVGNELGGM